MNSKGNQITRAGSRKISMIRYTRVGGKYIIKLKMTVSYGKFFIFEPYLEPCKIKRELVGAKK